MPTWGEILPELKETQRQIQSGQYPPDSSSFDIVRRKYLSRLAQPTGRSVIPYASKWTQWAPGIPPELVSIGIEDVQGFMEVMHQLPEGGLDLVLHSPGGSAEAAEAIVKYLRSKFNDIRVFVPHVAMSAATMLCCAANRIIMGKHSYLGPIDPQFIIQTELGRTSVAAHAIEEQFQKAKTEIQAQPSTLPAWLPILRQYGPALIVQCQLARDLSEKLVADWLSQYMFARRRNRSVRGKNIAAKLADHANFKSHSRFIDRQQAKQFGLVIDDLEEDQKPQDATLTVFHAMTHTFNGTPTVKMIENHTGKAFLKMQQLQQPVSFPLPIRPIPTMPSLAATASDTVK
jgi:hypothetical protein